MTPFTAYSILFLASIVVQHIQCSFLASIVEKKSKRKLGTMNNVPIHIYLACANLPCNTATLEDKSLRCIYVLLVHRGYLLYMSLRLALMEWKGIGLLCLFYHRPPCDVGGDGD